MRRVVVAGWLLAALFAAPFAASQSAPEPRQPVIEDLIDEAFDSAYNLDRPQAIALVRQAIALAPDEPAPHRALASMLWLQMVFERGAVTVDHYLPDMTGSHKHLPKPRPELHDEFQRELDRAIELAEARVRRRPADVAARYDAGSAYALRASYIATIDGSMTGAFRWAKRAFDAQEEVLKRALDHASASVVVGTYRYIVGALSLPTRIFAYIVGFGGGKDRGIQMLETATGDPRAFGEAGTALMLIYSREGRHRDAYEMGLRMAARYPRNRLFLLEAGSAAIRAGMVEAAEDVLTRGLSRHDLDARPKFPGERAAWLHRRAMARILLNRREDAAADLRAALDAGTQGWIEGRIHVELGKLADLAGDRTRALAEYQRGRTICDALDDATCKDEVRSLQRRAFTLPGRR